MITGLVFCMNGYAVPTLTEPNKNFLKRMYAHIEEAYENFDRVYSKAIIQLHMIFSHLLSLC